MSDAEGHSTLLMAFLFFFFFQAEDGIRDHCVTGVQTCALPILPVATFSLVQLLSPAVPAEAGGPPCDGAPVSGSAFQAKTGELGLNARSGPGTTFAPARRFDASCVIGVGGYCVGEGVNDVAVPLPDVRWLRLHRTEVYVSAGLVFPLSAESELGAAPLEDCPLATPEPSLDGDVEVSVVGDDSRQLRVRPAD